MLHWGCPGIARGTFLPSEKGCRMFEGNHHRTHTMG